LAKQEERLFEDAAAARALPLIKDLPRSADLSMRNGTTAEITDRIVSGYARNVPMEARTILTSPRRMMQIRRELPEVESEVQQDYAASYGQGTRSNTFFAQEKAPVKVTTTVKERFRLAATDADQERIQNLQTELQMVKADLERAPAQSRAFDRIRVELDSVRSDLERPSRARSFSPTSRVQTMVPMSPMVTVAPVALWPPPPLPPLAADVSLRLSALEARGPTPEDVACERLIEQQLEKLRELQAYVGQQQTLQEQLQLRNSEWSKRIEMLDQRSQEQEQEFERSIREAVRLVEERGRREVEKLQLEVQAARSNALAKREERQREAQEEIASLERELQSAMMESSARRQSGSMLEIDLQRERRELIRLREEMARLEAEGSSIAKEIATVRSSSNDNQDLSSYTLKIRQTKIDMEDRERELRELQAQCTSLTSDVQHIKTANDQRGQEAAKIRQSIKDEKMQIESLKRQRDTFTSLDVAQEHRSSFVEERRSFVEERRSLVETRRSLVTETENRVAVDIYISESSSSSSSVSGEGVSSRSETWKG
jgi:hypothetical protein